MMRKFFYGISIFLFLCLLSLGYYRSYQRISQKAQIKSGGIQIGDEYIPFRTLYEEVPVEAAGEEGEYGLYYLAEKDGYVAVYENDKKTLFEPTSIRLSSLPGDLQKEIKRGKFIKSQKELYSFLENYST